MWNACRASCDEVDLPAFTTETLERLTGISVTDASRDRLFSGLPPLAAAPESLRRQDEIMRDVEDVIASGRFRVIGQQTDKEIWQKGWSEVAAAMRRADRIDLETLKPQYFHRDVPFRYFGGYATATTPHFEYYAGIAVRRQLMLATFPGCERMLELGCGTGMNVILAADLFPRASLTGTDWVAATSDILTIVSNRLGRDIASVQYDMLSGEGRDRVPIDAQTDVLTVHALEQLGDRAAPVVEHLIAARPRRCLHIEPIVDFYDRSDPFDDVAARYHLARGYLVGLLPTLERHGAAGRIEILARGRVKLGNLYHEAYSYVSWRPM